MNAEGSHIPARKASKEMGRKRNGWEGEKRKGRGKRVNQGKSDQEKKPK